MYIETQFELQTHFLMKQLLYFFLFSIFCSTSLQAQSDYQKELQTQLIMAKDGDGGGWIKLGTQIVTVTRSILPGQSGSIGIGSSRLSTQTCPLIGSL